MIEITYENKKNKAVLSGDYFDEIREKFSVENKAAFFIKKYNRFIPTRKYAITPSGRFDPGLVEEIKKFLINKNYAGTLNISKELQQIINPSYSIPSNFTNHKLSLELRDYQEEIVNICLKKGRGTVVLATAGGKTLTMANLLSNIFLLKNKKIKCLIIVPDRGLVEQTYNDFISYDVPFTISKWTGDDEPNFNTNIFIANLGILQSEKSDLSPILDVDILIIDEVHKLRKDNKINKLLGLIKTPSKYGFTGTMPEELEDQWNIIGKIGPIIYEKNSFELRVESYISNVIVNILKIFYKTSPSKLTTNNPTDKYRNELNFLIDNSYRNSIIKKISDSLSKNVLIMVDFIRHGQELFDILKNDKKKVYFIRGEVEVEEREKIRNLLEKHDNIIVVAISKIFSTGVNIKNLHYLIFAGGGKAKIRLVQSIGRGLRLHINKSKLIIFDIADQLYYGIQHMQKRTKIYEKEKIQKNEYEFIES